ncbi:MAG: hypothetical protein IJ043_09570 [Clostridia bacterium]|nr:hypothetical protein [Clostridia bacterium]
MKKRILSALSAAVMVLSLFSVIVLPAGAVEAELQAIINEYAKYDFALFTEGEAMASLYERAQEADADAAALIAEEASIVKTLKNSYPHLVPYAQKEAYAAFSEGVKDWAITCAADWRAAVAAKISFQGQSLHLTNDIDMENLHVDPLCTGGLSFKGTLDGHGYSFLNLLIEWDLSVSNHVGLIGYAQKGCVVQELGLANGLVRAYGAQTTEAKVGALMGEGDDVVLRHCWSAVNVDSTGGDSKGGQTTSGLARTRNQSVIDGCFSVGTVKGNGYSGTLSGYVQGSTKVYNSFAIGTAIGAVASFLRYNGDGKVVNAQNSYAAGNSSVYCPVNYSVDVSAYQLSAAAYKSGELAWKLNNGMAGNTATYYTVQDGKTVFGTAENQTRRIAMVLKGGETKYVYGSAGEQVKLNYAIGASYEGEAEIVGNLLTVPDEDIAVNVTLSDLDYNALEIALAQYEDISFDFLVNGEAAKELVDGVNARIEAGYLDQETIDADVKALNEAFVYVSGDGLPSATLVDRWPDLPGYSISSLEELEYVAENIEKFTAEHTLYFTADIAVSEGSAANRLQLLKASLDGMGHTLSGLMISGDAWLGDYAGSAVKNLTLEDCHAVNQPWQGALLIKNLQSAHLVLEDLTFRNCSAAKGTGNGLGLLLGIQQKFNTTEIRNILVEDCTLDRGVVAGNSGFIVGREQNGTLIAEDIYLKNNTILGVFGNGGKGIAFGEVTGTATMKNIGIFNTVVEGNSADAALIGTFKNCDSGNSPGILSVENVYSGNNNLSGLIRRGNTTGVIRLGNAYTDGNYLIYHSTHLTELVGSGATASEALYGGGAYALNNAGVEKKWEFPAGGDAPVWDNDGQGLPVKVTFTAGELTERYYTDTEGKLAGLSNSIFEYANWSGIADFEALQKMVFTEDTEYIGSLGETYKIMSQNLCVWGGNDKKPYMIQRIALYDPDIILMQEGNKAWIDYLQANLKDYTIFYKYRYVNNLESCPLAWKTDKFEAVETGYFWISDTPDVESLGWDGGCYRIVTWAVLKDKATGEQIIASTFHLDHMGKIARNKGGPLVYERLLELRERYPGSMFFTAADFNCGEGSVAYNAMIQEDLADVRYEAAVTTTRPTYGNGLNADWSGAKDSQRIDFMMTDITTAKVMEFQVLEEIYGVTETSPGTRISDHNGLLTTVVSMASKEAFCTHEWTVSDNGDGTHKRSCTAGCGYTADVAHSDRYTLKDGVTHTTACIYCGATGEEACVHEITETAATCTADGFTTYFCNDCKYTKTVAGEKATGHTYLWNAAKADYICRCNAAYTVQDLNGDGSFNTADAASLMQYITGGEIEIDLMAADAHRDQRISIADAVAVLRKLAE